MKGWVSIYRSVWDHWIWEDPKKFKWWVDLILMANHQPKKIMINNQLITIERGERHTSEAQLAARWGVSRNTVRKFLNLLESDNMIETTKSRQKGTTYKIVNYSLYQDNSEEKKHQNEQQAEQQSEHQKDNELNNELNINNNDNKFNNENNENKSNIPFEEIVSYLNEKANRNYRHTTNKNQSLIKARWNEGFNLDDFKKVVDNKVNEWEGSDMSKYLRPETLFGPKFEGYLNQKQAYEPTPTDDRYSNLPF